MTAYSGSPFAKVPALLPGVVSYSWGSRSQTVPTRMSIQSVAISSNVATLAVTILEGPIPVVANSFISVQGTVTATSGGAPNFNVTNVALTGVTINATTGIGTVTFALTSSNIATTTDSGVALVPQPTVPESLGTATSGQEFAIQSQSGGNKQHGLTWFTEFTGSPATVTMQLQIADIDRDADYTTIDQSTNASGETRSVGNVTANFVRVRAAGTGGTSPKVAAGIVLS